MPPQPAPNPSPLPPPRAFLTNLLHTFSAHNPPSTKPANPPPSTKPATKPLLLTLHALFPTTLLPALDLLDRRLITKLVYDPTPSAAHHDTAVDDAGVCVREYDTDMEVQGARRGKAGVGELGIGESGVGGKRAVYYVKSATQQRDGRARYGVGATAYEVRTRGWSCSCKAFAFGAFNEGEGWGYEEGGGYGDGVDDEEEMLLDVEEGLEEVEERGEWVWGGFMVGESVPLCKHLFACVLAEHWDVAGGMVEEREVGREEMAGWAAGWGG